MSTKRFSCMSRFFFLGTWTCRFLKNRSDKYDDIVVTVCVHHECLNEYPFLYILSNLHMLHPKQTKTFFASQQSLKNWLLLKLLNKLKSGNRTFRIRIMHNWYNIIGQMQMYIIRKVLISNFFCHTSWFYLVVRTTLRIKLSKRLKW